MKVEELFLQYGIENEQLKKEILYLLADFGCLMITKRTTNEEEDEEETEEVYVGDIDYYQEDELLVSDYDIECGAYHNHQWFSFTSIIKSLKKCYDRYDF